MAFCHLPDWSAYAQVFDPEFLEGIAFPPVVPVRQDADWTADGIVAVYWADAAFSQYIHQNQTHGHSLRNKAMTGDAGHIETK